MPRDDDRHRLQWIRYQELAQFRLFRLLRLRRTQRGRYPEPPPAQPPSEPPPDPSPRGDR